jgi:glutamyl-tRNA reductase
MDLMVVGINHNRAPREIRSLFAPGQAKSKALVESIRSQASAKGVVVLSTCGRFEIYADGADLRSIKDVVFNSSSLKEHSSHFYRYHGHECACHLFRVAAGLDSAVIGEREILTQVEDASIQAEAMGVLSLDLKNLFDIAMKTSGWARKAAGFDPRFSIATEAVKRVERLTGDIADNNIYILGTGLVARSLAMELKTKGARPVIVGTRHFDKALGLASDICSRALTMQGFFKELKYADIVFSATASPHCILTAGSLKVHIQNQKKILLVDLAVPPDIESAARNVRGVTLLTIDDISASLYPGERLALAEDVILKCAERYFERDQACALS